MEVVASRASKKKGLSPTRSAALTHSIVRRLRDESKTYDAPPPLKKALKMSLMKKNKVPTLTPVQAATQSVYSDGPILYEVETYNKDEAMSSFGSGKRADSFSRSGMPSF